MTAIEFNNVGKMYRLGRVGTGTLSHDLNRWWQMSVLGKEDPYLKIGQTNDRTTKGESDYVWALRDISFKVEQGEVLGIIGKNGAGKSTLLKLLSNITSPSTGMIKYNGRIASLLEVGTGFHPEMTGRENIYMNGSIMGMTKHEITRKLDEIVDFAGVERYLDTPVKRYSSGMTVRLGFAVAAFLEPEILVVDEVLTVGDAEFQKKAIGKMNDVAHEGGRTVLFVSHNMTAVKQLCTQGILLQNGQLAFSGTAKEVIEEYLSVNPDFLLTPLAQRKDRYGNGRVRLTNILFFNENDVAVSECFVNQYLRIELQFEINDLSVDPNKLIVACGLFDSYATSVVSWVSDEMSHNFSNFLDKHTISIIIPNVNLRPQSYNIKVQVSEGTTNTKDFCDVIHNASVLNVLNDSAFTPGINLKVGRGHQALVPANFD